MSILSILGGGGGSPQPTQQPSNQQPTGDSTDQTSDAATQSQDSGAATSGNAAQSQDTTAPAPATGAGDTAKTANTPPSNPETEATRVSQLADSGGPTTAQAIIEAALTDSPDQIEADARRFAEAAQQQQRLEQLIAAVGTPVEATNLTAPTAEQEQVGTEETDGVPV